MNALSKFEWNNFLMYLFIEVLDRYFTECWRVLMVILEVVVHCYAILKYSGSTNFQEHDITAFPCSYKVRNDYMTCFGNEIWVKVTYITSGKQL